jgi:hypothetical protein
MFGLNLELLTIYSYLFIALCFTSFAYVHLYIVLEPEGAVTSFHMQIMDAR